ncbi:MAG: hypothetical protein HY912_08910 [Desulfomonile tiedjei]|uniref:Uncharacterized protein n=1 Tax=Desulfomonile tiedjei TaxID=2358 RepID=A0A9D6Z5X9_9BACT|nr:hypothetical protein [Desulfomonile tiedjei]
MTVALLCVIAPLLLLVRRRWSLIAIQLAAYVGAAIWLNTLVDLVQARMIMHRPWGTAVIILASASLFSIFSGWLMNSPALKSRYRSRPAPQEKTSS